MTELQQAGNRSGKPLLNSPSPMLVWCAQMEGQTGRHLDRGAAAETRLAMLAAHHEGTRRRGKGRSRVLGPTSLERVPPWGRVSQVPGFRRPGQAGGGCSSRRWPPPQSGSSGCVPPGPAPFSGELLPMVSKLGAAAPAQKPWARSAGSTAASLESSRTWSSSL